MNAEQVNDLFVGFIGQYSIKPEVIGPALYQLEHLYYEMTKGKEEETKQLKVRLTEVNKKIDTIEEKHYVLEEMNTEAFEKFHKRYLQEKREIEENLERFSGTISNLPDHLKTALSGTLEM